MNTEEIIRHREWLHSHPELSFNEFETQSYIKGVLDSHAIDSIAVADTGLLAVIGDRSNSAILLRADIDALPIEEQTALPYSSLNSGVMHACGHDVHAASLLGALISLSKNPPLDRTIVALFQPGEEVAPGGAIKVIESGVLDEFNIIAAIAIHCSPELKSGTFGLHSGAFMASADEVHIKVIGKGGHAARPQSHRNPIWAAVDLLSSLHNIESPNHTPSILSFGRVIAGGATNIIPDVVEIAGTLRTFDEGWRSECKAEIERLCLETQTLHNLDIELSFGEGYPSLLNDAIITTRVSEIVSNEFGVGSVIEVPQRMTAEDFGHISQRYCALMVRLGVSDESHCGYELHTPRFCATEDSPVLGARLFEAVARKLTI